MPIKKVLELHKKIIYNTYRNKESIVVGLLTLNTIKIIQQQVGVQVI